MKSKTNMIEKMKKIGEIKLKREKYRKKLF